MAFQNSSMIEWLKSQVCVLEAWREDVASRADLDIDMIMRLERHYQWLTAEVSNLEARCSAEPFGHSRYRLNAH